MAPINIVDRTVRRLVRRSPGAFLSLLGISVDASRIRFEDTAVILPELRGDNVLTVLGQRSKPEWGVHFEFDLNASGRDLLEWQIKSLGLTKTLGFPVPLCVIYLSKGRRATFDSSYSVGPAALTNVHTFHTILLWEHRDRILSGELAELAPLLTLCYARPSRRVLEEERRLILGIGRSRQEKADLLGMAAAVGTRYFSQEVLREVFREEVQMLKETSFIEEWLQEREDKGKREGQDEGARKLATELLTEWFGQLPPAAIARIQQADEPYCRELIIRAHRASSLDVLGLG